MKKTTAKKAPVSKVIVVLLITVGIALVLYPTAADVINGYTVGRTVTDYESRTADMGGGDVDEMLADAAAYNAELAEDTPYIGELTARRRKVYNSLLDVTGTGIMGYIEVPKADINLPVYHGTSDSVLRSGVGHLEASSLPVPSDSATTVLTGHSGLPSARLFTDLDMLEKGDCFYIRVLNERYTYKVEQTVRLLPDDMKNLRISEGREVCVLVTCTPYGVNTHRLAVVGVKTDDRPASDGLLEQDTKRSFFASKWNRVYEMLFPAGFAAVVAVSFLVFRKIKRRRRAAKSKQT